MDFNEVKKHNTPQSCWVVISNTVYDVTSFLPSHPGGASTILKYAGKDATEEYELIHPPGTIEETLSPSQILGALDTSTVLRVDESSSTSVPAAEQQAAAAVAEGGGAYKPPPLGAQLSIDDFEKTAERLLSPKAWAYYSSASDDQLSKTHNNKAYTQILLRPRIFKDVREVSTSTTLCGSASAMPVFVAPAAMARLAHPSGEAGIAEACGRGGVLQCVSNNASLRPEQIAAARVSEQPLWFQLYVQTDRRKSEAVLKRISEGCGGAYTAVVLTLDAPAPGKREADERVKNQDGNISSGISGQGVTSGDQGGLGKALFAGTARDLVWEDLRWLRTHTTLPIILKGIQTHEDALLAASPESLALGVKGIILSNHGGRALDTAPPPLYTLMEIRRFVPEVFGKLEVYVDGGVRRGTDVVKAVCLGARAVGVGRAALYGLAGYGTEGVERVLNVLKEEIETAMRLLGVNSIHELSSKHVNTRALDHLIYQSEEGEREQNVRARL